LKEEYTLLDSGEGLKLEAFGNITLCRPAAQAVWNKQYPALWKKADAAFSREGKMSWTNAKTLPNSWSIEVAGIQFKLLTTDFGHLGIFPEQKPQWIWIRDFLQKAKLGRPPRLLNLFAYSGGVTMAAAQSGAEVCHLDASKGMVDWARENAKLNKLDKAPIRWIVDDVKKFLKRELKRGISYDAIVLDPPTFGRGNQGELFKIEKEIVSLLDMCRSLLSSTPLFILLSCHTPGFSPLVMQNLLDAALKDKGGVIDCGEMALRGSDSVYPLPSGTFARWIHGN
jgi:23S rRNA (cytosine1962-C5)-methyltransferase